MTQWDGVVVMPESRTESGNNLVTTQVTLLPLALRFVLVAFTLIFALSVTRFKTYSIGFRLGVVVVMICASAMFWQLFGSVGAAGYLSREKELSK